jgi:hypothetical protein
MGRRLSDCIATANAMASDHTDLGGFVRVPTISSNTEKG